MKPSKQKSNIRLSKRKKTKSRKVQNKFKKTHSRQQKNNKKKRSHRKIGGASQHGWMSRCIAVQGTLNINELPSDDDEGENNLDNTLACINVDTDNDKKIMVTALENIFKNTLEQWNTSEYDQKKRQIMERITALENIMKKNETNIDEWNKLGDEKKKKEIEEALGGRAYSADSAADQTEEGEKEGTDEQLRQNIKTLKDTINKIENVLNAETRR